MIAGTIALSTLRPTAVADGRLTLVSVLRSNALWTSILSLDVGLLTVLALAIDFMAALLVLLVGAVGTEARMRCGEYEES